MTIREIKAIGKKIFRGNYWNSVIAAFLLVLLVGGATASGATGAGETVNGTGAGGQDLSSAVASLPKEAVTALISVFAVIGVGGLLLKIFVFNPLQVGCYRFFNKNARDTSATLSAIKEGFGGYGRTLITLLLTNLFTFLWGLLFIIPGIIKSYSYRLVPYILRDEPDLSPTQVIRRSREMMRGNKWKAFVLDLSFIGWYLLSILTAGLLNVFWTEPYRANAGAVFYNDLKG